MAILIITSVSCWVLQNCLFNKVCKRELEGERQINAFNIVVYAVCVITFGILLLGNSISVYTILLGLLFGIVTALCGLYKMLALSCGPMHITMLITTSSMIISALSGIFFGETFSFPKLCAILVLLFFIYLTLDKTGESKISLRWMLYCGLAFLLQGIIGVIQKIHQSSIHKSEASGFLFVAFIWAIVFCLIKNKGKAQITTIGKKNILIGIVCGGCTFAMNYINLKLSGLLPSQLFFPLVNGSVIVLSCILSVVLFKEKLSKRQMIGLIGGIGSLISICLVG